jgi:hypothetical protein
MLLEDHRIRGELGRLLGVDLQEFKATVERLGGEIERSLLTAQTS